MKTSSYQLMGLGTIILSLLILAGCNSFTQRKGDSIHIAFAGPMTGEGAAAGILMSQAVQLYLDELNKKGGIYGKTVILDIYDDQNDCQDQANQMSKAKQVANQIVEENKALAVIGHWYSGCSITGGEIYKKYKIPAFTPGSEDIKVTQDNEWYFRNIYNIKAPAQFLANYVKNVFRQDTVTIIHETADYGSYLAKVFEETSRKLGLEVKNVWSFDSKQKDLEQSLQQLVTEQLKPIKKDAGVLLLAVQAQEGVKLVKLIKDEGITNPILGDSSLSEETFRQGFKNFPLEKANPGYYINDIYVATPLIFDTANEIAQKFKDSYKQTYGQEADWSAAYAYDTIMVLIKAMKEAPIEGNPETVATDRQKIRDTLATFTNIEDAIMGVTGLNYFDEHRDSQKTVSLGIYKNRNYVSALTQLQVMRSTSEIADLDEAIKDERVLLINDKHMYRTNVVYTGIDFRDIVDLNMKELTCTLDFYIWFRFQGNFKPEDIEFVNAVNSQEIREQLAKEPVAKKTKDKITYRLYHIHSQFKADFLSENAYKQHVLGVKFRHRNLTRHNLIYVTDDLGMGLSANDNLAVRLKQNQVLNPLLGWTINRVLFFPDIAKKSSLGDPKYLNALEGLVEYSQFNAAIRIEKAVFTFRNQIPYQYSYKLIALSTPILFLLVLASRKVQRHLKYFWFLQAIMVSVWLISSEVIIVTRLAEDPNWYNNLKLFITFFDLLWWVILAFFVQRAAEHFLWTPLQAQIGNIPNIIRHFFALMIYLIALTAIIVFVFEQEFTSLLATSGMLAMIIGLAVKINIANIFSGMVINMDRPFRVGDWVKIGAFEEAEVNDINWRATRVQTRAKATVSLANSVAIESAILNFYAPTKIFWLWPTVYVHPRHSPDRVKKILLDAVLSVNSILKDPAPIIYFTGINQWAASYWVAFCSDDYDQKYYILADVWNQIWLHLTRAAIQPAVKRQEVYMFYGHETANTISLKPPEAERFKFAAEATHTPSKFPNHEEFINQGKEEI